MAGRYIVEEVAVTEAASVLQPFGMDLICGGGNFAATGGGVFLGTGGDDFRAGWTVGAGAEWGFAPNWSVKAEYLYYDLGNSTVLGTDPAFPAFATSTTFENTGHIGRVGINYRFGGPVVARY